VTGVVETNQMAGQEPVRGGPKRLAIFTSHPIQYQAPYFRALAASGRVRPTVYFGSRHGVDVALDTDFGTAFRWDVPLLDGYEHVFLTNTARTPNVSTFRGVRLGRPERVITPDRHDALLVLGWQTLAHVQMLRAAWKSGVPVLVRGESTLQRSPATGLRGVARRAFGVPDEKLYWVPYGVDNAWFSMSEPARSLARARVRDRLGMSDDMIVVASAAKLIPRKRPLDVVDAVVDLCRRGVEAHALFIGDGEQRSAVQQRAERSGIDAAVSIAGFVNQQELPAWYAAADVLVLPSDSRETWGLVANEAMAAGLPVVVSDAAGCSVDLVREGENGFTYPCGDVRALAARLGALVELGVEGRREMGNRSRDIVARFDIDVAAAATVAAVESVCARAGAHA
jgi:glycosyltransferase involved in cell wall biosynthesis